MPTQIHRIIYARYCQGKVENVFKDVDCAIVCASIADSQKVDNLIFSSRNLPTILSTIGAARKSCDSFMFCGVPVEKPANILGMPGIDDDDGEDEEDGERESFEDVFKKTSKINELIESLFNDAKD